MITRVPVKKVVTTDGDTYKLNTVFTLCVTTGAADAYEGNVVYEGEEGGLSAFTAATFTPSEKDTVEAVYEETAYLAVDVNNFDKPGVYHYVVTEKKESYEGIIYDDTSYDVYVYVYNNAAGDGLEVRDMVVVKDRSVA